MGVRGIKGQKGKGWGEGKGGAPRGIPGSLLGKWQVVQPSLSKRSQEEEPVEGGTLFWVC